MGMNAFCRLLRPAFGIALASAIGALPAWADTTLVVGKAAADADAIMAVDVGDQAGLFKKRGLDLKIVLFEGGGKMIQALAAGSVDIGDAAGIQMAFIVKGAPMMAVCENTSTLPYLSLGLPWDSPVKSKSELKGKRIGISSAGSLTDWIAQQLARHEGWAPDDIQRIAIGVGAPMVAAFHEHMIDAYVGGNTTFLALEEKKQGRFLSPVSEFVGNIASGTLYASNHLIATNPDALRAFLAAWIDTTEFIRTHKAETVKIQAKVTGYSEAIMSHEYDIVRSMYTKDCRFDSEALANLSRSFIDLKMLDAPPDMSKLYTEAYLPK